MKLRQDHSQRNLLIVAGGFFVMVFIIFLTNGIAENSDLANVSASPTVYVVDGNLRPLDTPSPDDIAFLETMSAGIPAYTSDYSEGTMTPDVVYWHHSEDTDGYEDIYDKVIEGINSGEIQFPTYSSFFDIPPLSSNLILNGDFEQDDNDWQDSPTYLGSGYESPTALCLTLPKITPAETNISQTLTVTPNTAYNFSAWFQWQDAEDVYITVQQHEGFEVLPEVRIIQMGGGSSDGWRMQQSQFTASSGFVTITIHSDYRTHPTADSRVCLDDVILASVNGE